MKNVLFDEKIDGSIHLALGQSYDEGRRQERELDPLGHRQGPARRAAASSSTARSSRRTALARSEPDRASRPAPSFPEREEAPAAERRARGRGARAGLGRLGRLRPWTGPPSTSSSCARRGTTPSGARVPDAGRGRCRACRESRSRRSIRSSDKERYLDGSRGGRRADRARRRSSLPGEPFDPWRSPFVVKPAISAGGRMLRAVRRGRRGGRSARRTRSRRWRTAMVQPFVDGEEPSLVYVDGEYSHALSRRAPLPAGRERQGSTSTRSSRTRPRRRRASGRGRGPRLLARAHPLRARRPPRRGGARARARRALALSRVRLGAVKRLADAIAEALS